MSAAIILATEPLATALRPASINAGPWRAARSAPNSAARRQARPPMTARMSYMWLRAPGPAADHAAMARGFGLHAERVETAEQLREAIQRALAAVQAGRPALLDVLVTPEAASSDAKSGLAWVPELQALAAWDEAEQRWRQG